MLINLSNHLSSKWSKEQLIAANIYGEIIDVAFPDVDPNGDESYISSLVDEYEAKVVTIAGEIDDITIHVMGEMNFTYSFANRMKQRDILCIASTTRRIVEQISDDKKIVRFQFIKFRSYE